MTLSAPWQLDFYRRPLQDANGNPLWELLICGADMAFTYGEFCSQPEASAPWVCQQLQKAHDHAGGWPPHIEVFRPQSISLAEVACRDLPVAVKPRRDTLALKQWLKQRAAWYPTLSNYVGEPYEPIALDRPTPTPIADYLMGDSWQFAAVSPADLQRLQQEPIPIQSVPGELSPVGLGLPSTIPIPGIIIDGGRQSMRLAQWLQSANPVMLQYIAGAPDGVLLEAGLADRWILTTFTDDEVAAAARTFTERKLAAEGLHFLLIRPDDSGMTYTALWLLQSTAAKAVEMKRTA
ncbi:MAG: Tab2 family RNA-binding protein [Cyanobacteria bacterium P01_C01_bin.69]